MYQRAVACFHAEPHRGVPGGTKRTWIGRPPLTVGCDEAAAEEAQAAMIEIVALEIIDHRWRRARADERIHLIVDKHQNARGGLVAIVLADDAFARGGIVGLTDASAEQELRIVERVGAKHDKVGRLFDLALVKISPACDIMSGLFGYSLLRAPSKILPPSIFWPRRLPALPEVPHSRSK